MTHGGGEFGFGEPRDRRSCSELGRAVKTGCSASRNETTQPDVAELVRGGGTATSNRSGRRVAETRQNRRPEVPRRLQRSPSRRVERSDDLVWVDGVFHLVSETMPLEVQQTKQLSLPVGRRRAFFHHAVHFVEMGLTDGIGPDADMPLHALGQILRHRHQHAARCSWNHRVGGSERIVQSLVAEGSLVSEHGAQQPDSRAGPAGLERRLRRNRGIRVEI
mmetsp:Transcript_69177/g.162754  ORF Transcript_69177/g.162754 Transcript_69177/m.162754 type:complete len:220 (-) Transcript_69177:691-1350(-)